jgi:serine/threonine-protein kinase
MPTLIKNGDLIGDRYQIRALLGSGGMGVVFEAIHLQLRQRVAIKVLAPELCEEPEAVARFLREARAMVQINSEHVARVTDVGTLDSGEPYIVMEHLEGSDLGAVLERSGRVSVEEAATYLVQASDAIAEAHSIGVIHRDLKPSNLFLTRRRDGSSLVKVLDFGISKAVPTISAGRTSMRTATSVVMGSPLYMSPEQLRSSKNVDPRSDVWSLGVLLHELLAGEPPFSADTLPGLLAKIIADPPTPLRSARSDTPPALEAAVQRCLEKDPEDRYQTVSDFAKALEPFAPRAVHQPFARTLHGVQHAELRSRPGGAAPPAVEGRTSSEAPTAADTVRSWAGALRKPLRAPPARVLFIGGCAGVALLAGIWRAQRAAPESRELASQTAAPLPPGAAALPRNGGATGASRAGKFTRTGAPRTSAPVPEEPPRALQTMTPRITQLSPARWSVLEQAAIASTPRPVKGSPRVDDDHLFDDRK